MSYTDPMYWFTSIGLPAIVVVGAYIAVRLHERSIAREDEALRKNPKH